MYKYGDQLATLKACSMGRPALLPERLRQITTPLKLEKWRAGLEKHPDKEFTELILQGIEEGFRVGYDARAATLKQKPGNLISAAEQPEVVSIYLEKELRASRILRVGSEDEARSLGIHCSPFGVIPKKNKPNKWRLIVNLSALESHSVNDGISKELASLSYVSVDDVAARVRQLGRGTVMAKMDIKQAYRNVPIHPADRYLLGMAWKGKVYIDTALPYGLRSAPLIFTALADALQWIMEQKGAVHIFHYIDDFITLGAPDSPECSQSALIMHEACEEMGLPTEPDKDEGPATTISFLALEIRLRQDKLVRMRAELSKWRGRKACRKRELLSLIGTLSHACKAVRAGRSFLRRLIDLSMVVKTLDHHVRLSREARSDIEWWFQFSASWNGVAMLREAKEVQASVSITSDASGGWGCGAFTGPEWFMVRWAESYKDCHITTKGTSTHSHRSNDMGQEMAGLNSPGLVRQCRGGEHHQPWFLTRNQEAMHLARCLAFIKAKLEFNMVASHI